MAHDLTAFSVASGLWIAVVSSIGIYAMRHLWRSAVRCRTI
jgi:hypothetical protein